MNLPEAASGDSWWSMRKAERAHIIKALNRGTGEFIIQAGG